MKPSLFFLAAAMSPLLLSAAPDSTVAAPIRGKTLNLARLSSTATDSSVAVVFLPGDGGWRGAAITMGRTIASWGYDVYGFDTKKYLEVFSDNGAKLSPEVLAADVRSIANQVSGPSRRRVVLVGWSQGATMSIAAVSGVKSRAPIAGVVTLGLPENGVLGWDWKATLAIIARREPNQPTFAVKPLLPGAAPMPVWMIHGTEDEYTTTEVGRTLFQAAQEPKKLEEIQGANHRFDGHQDELFQSLKKGISWVVSTN